MNAVNVNESVLSYTDTKCIVCGGLSNLVIELHSSEIKAALSNLFGDSGINSISIENYRLLHCQVCELEFAYPQVHATNDFYNWLVKNKSYYPASRWEWSEVTNLLNSLSKSSGETLTVLDVGCGEGAFLERFIGIEKLRVVGIDLTESSVHACQARGIEAYCCELSGIHEWLDERISVVTAFHVLEHISNPVQFLKGICQLLEPGGCALISTPFSPMSFEVSWFDPLNHPPHHLTRWNVKSYTALAKQVGMDVEFIFPAAKCILSRAISVIKLKISSPFIPEPVIYRTFRLAAYLFMHPLVVIDEILKQSRRFHIHNKVAPDSVLVKFKKVAAV